LLFTTIGNLAWRGDRNLSSCSDPFEQFVAQLSNRRRFYRTVAVFIVLQEWSME
jgi:hypothetical protein